MTRSEKAHFLFSVDGWGTHTSSTTFLKSELVSYVVRLEIDERSADQRAALITVSQFRSTYLGKINLPILPVNTFRGVPYLYFI